MNDSNKTREYWPLISLIIVAVLAGTALCYGVNGGMLEWMHYVMGVFLCQFSLLKLFDIPGFADGFQMYDLIAKRSRAYALAYPLIELMLGLALLSFLNPVLTYLIIIVVMLIGTISVVKALREGLDINCPCMGTILNVPLSTVTLTEDAGMGIMALIMLASRFI